MIIFPIFKIISKNFQKNSQKIKEPTFFTKFEKNLKKIFKHLLMFLYKLKKFIKFYFIKKNFHLKIKFYTIKFLSIISNN